MSELKDRLPVLKSEAMQIYILDDTYAIINNKSCLEISKKSFGFIVFSERLNESLLKNNLYKDYEWVLTPIKSLKQGDICKLTTFNNIFIYDKNYVWWSIENNRPKEHHNRLVLFDDKVYKLCKKEKNK